MIPVVLRHFFARQATQTTSNTALVAHNAANLMATSLINACADTVTPTPRLTQHAADPKAAPLLAPAEQQLANIDCHQSQKTVWEICDHLKGQRASADDVAHLMAVFVNETGSLTAAWRSQCYRWSDIEHYVFDKLHAVGATLAKGKVPLQALHELFLGCEHFLLRANRFETDAVGSYSYTVRLIQSFAARQWHHHAKALNEQAAKLCDSLFLYRGPSKIRSATSYALQALEDLKPNDETEVVDFLFETHDAVRGALGLLSNHIMTLEDFHNILGSRGWHGLATHLDQRLKYHIHDKSEDKNPVSAPEDPTLQALMLLSATRALPSGLREALSNEDHHPLVLKAINRGLTACEQLARATNPVETAKGLADLTQAAVMLAGVRPPEKQRQLKVIGEDERVMALNILLCSTPHRAAAIKNAAMAYICTPYVGGGVDQSRAQSVIVAMGKSLSLA